jgi:hypothetical protein
MSAVFEVIVTDDVSKFSGKEIFWLDEKLLWTSGYSNGNVGGGVITRLKMKFEHIDANTNQVVPSTPDMPA